MGKKRFGDFPRAWAWELENGAGLCFWAEPTKEHLENKPKPSPGAKAVCVRLVREKDFMALRVLP